jgi:hypothetical protein
MDNIKIVVLASVFGVLFVGVCITTLYLIKLVETQSAQSDTIVKKLDYIAKHLIEDKP